MHIDGPILSRVQGEAFHPAAKALGEVHLDRLIGTTDAAGDLVEGLVGGVIALRKQFESPLARGGGEPILAEPFRASAATHVLVDGEVLVTVEHLLGYFRQVDDGEVSGVERHAGASSPAGQAIVGLRLSTSASRSSR